MPRKNIIDLLDNELTESTSSTPIDQQATDVDQLKPPEDKPFAIDLEPEELTESVSSKQPRYLTLERKEVRLPAEHLDALTRLARRLNRARRGSGERITENTLIRVAIAPLIDHANQLKGTTEAELLDAWHRFVS